MASEQITKFFREKTAKAEAIVAGIDWSARRGSWLDAVNQLYDTIEHDYLASAENAAYVQVDRTRTKVIREPDVGSDSVPELVLIVGGEEVLFSPQGTIVYGATGRVDVRGIVVRRIWSVKPMMRGR